MAITRKPTATWVIPNEDEWFKVAYYDPDKLGTGLGGYWKYPTKSDAQPSNLLSSTGSNNANYYASDFTIGAPFYRTPMGAFQSSPSPYGTFDQGGNVAEWNEAMLETIATSVEHPPVFYHLRGYRGGAFDGYWAGTQFLSGLNADISPIGADPSATSGFIGFRVAYVPEPGAVALLFAGVAALLTWIRRVKLSRLPAAQKQ